MTMKNVATALATLVVLLLIASQAFAQPTLPDYTKWEKSSSAMSVVHHGKDVSLYAERYENLDADNLYQHSILVIHDEQKSSWIAFYTRALLYKDGDRLVVASFNYWLFDRSNNSWSLVKDFSQSREQDLAKETDDFLKSRYDLILK